jgi:hypothetical protein
MHQLASSPAVPLRAAFGALVLLVALWTGHHAARAVHGVRPGTELQYAVRVPHGPGIYVPRFRSNLIDGELATLAYEGVKPVRVAFQDDHTLVIDLPAMAPCQLRRLRHLLLMSASTLSETAVVSFKL